MTSSDMPDEPTGRWIYRPYILKDGKRVYPKTAKAFRFWVED